MIGRWLRNQVLGTLLGLALFGSPAVRAADEPSEAATRQFASAVALQNRGVYKLAAEEWVKFIDENHADPRLDKAFHYLGVCYLKSNELDAAAKSFQIVLDTYPQSEIAESSRLYLGVTQFTAGQGGQAGMYAKAAATLARLLAEHPQSKHAPQALFYRAEALYADGKKAEAAKVYSELLQKHPHHATAADALYALGVAQQETGDPAGAGKSFAAFLQQFPQNALVSEVELRRGETLFAAGQFAAAAEHFAKAAGDAKFAMADHALLRQATALAQAQKTAEAAAVYARLPKEFPQSAFVNLARLHAGKCDYLLGQYAAGADLLAKIPAADPVALDAAHWRARCLLKQNQAPEALEVAEAALAKAGKQPVAAQLRMDRADALYDLPDRRAQAAKQYADLAAADPRDPLAAQALYLAGYTELQLGDHAAALKHAQAFLERYPDQELTPDVTFVAAESQLQLGHAAEARKLLDDLLARWPKHADVDLWTVRRGSSLVVEKQYAAAIQSLQPRLAALQAPELAAEARWLIGSSQMELGQPAAAAQSLEESLAAAPRWRQAEETYLLLAQAYERMKQPQRVRDTLRKLIAEFPQGRMLDRAEYRLGESCYNSGEYAAAATAYQELLARWPNSPLAPAAGDGLVWTRLALNDFTAAEQAADDFLQRHPHDKLVPRVRYARATARHQLKHEAAAIEDVNAVLAADAPKSEKSDARYLLALCQVAEHQYEAAVATLRALLDDDKQYAGRDKVYYELAWAWKSLGREADAAEAFTWLTQASPHSPLAAESHFHAAEYAYAHNDWSKAAAGYRAAMELAPRTPLGEKAAHKLAWTWYRQDDFEKAREAFAAQRAAWPAGPLADDAAFLEAECLFKQKKYETALDRYAQVRHPAGADFGVLALLHAAQSAAQLNRWERALELASQAAKDFPTSTWLPEVLYEEGWAQQNLNQPERAIGLYQQVIAKTDREAAARAQFMIGELQFAQHQHAQALKSFIKAAYGYSYPKWQEDGMFEAARSMEALKLKDQALKQYRELVEKFPRGDKAELARQRIEELKK